MKTLATILLTGCIALALMPQTAGAIWLPGEPLIPCGGFTTITVDGETPNESGEGVDGGAVAISGQQPECDLPFLIKMIDNIITFLTIYISVPLAAVIFAFAGFKYITAGGNQSTIQAAHRMFSQVVVGLLIALGAFLIVHTIANAFLSSDALNYLQENVLAE